MSETPETFTYTTLTTEKQAQIVVQRITDLEALHYEYMLNKMETIATSGVASPELEGQIANVTARIDLLRSFYVQNYTVQPQAETVPEATTETAATETATETE